MYERFPRFDPAYSETYRAIAMGVLRLDKRKDTTSPFRQRINKKLAALI